MSELDERPLRFRSDAQHHTVGRRPRYWGWAAPAAAFVALGIATGAVLFGDGPEGFWARWPMLSSIVSSFVTLALTALVVDKLLKRRDRQLWSQVTAVSYRALARISRRTVGELASVYSQPGRQTALPWHQGITGTGNKHPLDQIRHARPKPGKDSLSVFTAEGLANDFDESGWVPLSRLRTLLRNSAWVDFAEDSLNEMVDENREAVGNWAATMLGESEARRFLNDFARLNEDIFTLQSLMRALVREQRTRRTPAFAELLGRACVWYWQALDAKERLLTNHLWAAAGEGEHSIALPDWLASRKQSPASVHLDNVNFPLGLTTPEAGLTPYRLSFPDAVGVHGLITALAPPMLRSAGGTDSEIRSWLTSHASLPVLQKMLASNRTTMLGIRDSHGGLLAIGGFTLRDGGRAEIHSLYVGVQGQGRGGWILGHLLLVAIKDGAKELSMVVSASNKPMLTLAANYGFQTADEHHSRSIPLSDFCLLSARPHDVFAFLELIPLLARANGDGRGGSRRADKHRVWDENGRQSRFRYVP